MATESVSANNLEVRRSLEEASVILCGVRGVIDVLTVCDDVDTAPKDALYAALRLICDAKDIVDRSSELLAA